MKRIAFLLAFLLIPAYAYAGAAFAPGTPAGRIGTTIQGDPQSCSIPTTVTITGGPVSYGGHDYIMSFDDSDACQIGVNFVVADSEGNPVLLWAMNVDDTPGDLYNLFASHPDLVDDITMCLITGSMGPQTVYISIMSDNCDNVVTILEGFGAESLSYVKDEDFWKWNGDTCGWDLDLEPGWSLFTGDAGADCNNLSFTGSPAIVEDSDIVYYWQLAPTDVRFFTNHVFGALAVGNKATPTVTQNANRYSINVLELPQDFDPAEYDGGTNSEVAGSQVTMMPFPDVEYPGSGNYKNVLGYKSTVFNISGRAISTIEGISNNAYVQQSYLNQPSTISSGVLYNSHYGALSEGSEITSLIVYNVSQPILTGTVGTVYGLKISSLAGTESTSYGIYSDAPLRNDGTLIEFPSLPSRSGAMSYVCVDGSGQLYISANGCDVE